MQQGSGQRNGVLVFSVLFHKAFQKGWGQSGHIHPSIPLITRPDICHHQTHARRNSRPPLRWQRPGSPAGSRQPWPGVPWGRGGWRTDRIHPLADNRHCQAQLRGWVVQRQKTGTLLEIRKGKKVNCIQREFPAPGFKSTSQASSQKLCLLIRSWGAVQADQEGCKHPPPPSFAASYRRHVYYCLLLAAEDAQHPFSCASYSAGSSTSPIPTTPCPPALDLASVFIPPMLHPLLYPIFSPFLYLFPPIQGLFSHLLSVLWTLSFLHPTFSTPQQAGGVEDRGKLEDKMGTPQQQGDT